mmetsp:Transcript_20915/g.65817  ORF Transcript_20915/g.65817 Transcript_20915/m.65817 type:complete len:110 (+) Transcript_20915:59-388(+)
MALVGGIGVGLFLLILFGALGLVTCFLGSASKRAPAIIAGTSLAYIFLLLVLVFSPKESEVTDENDGELTDPRLANTVLLMAVLGCTSICAIVAVCQNFAAVRITAKPV